MTLSIGTYIRITYHSTKFEGEAMARAGLSRMDIKRARDLLIAQGQHPSIDAIRIGLGNTGSKTTIHRYLKELEEEGI